MNGSENVSKETSKTHHDPETEAFQDKHAQEKPGDVTINDQKTTHQRVHDDPLADVECEEDEEDYVVPDPSHCDRYLVCLLANQRQEEDLATNKRQKGESSTNRIELCEEDTVLDTETGYCGPRDTVDCGARHLNFRDNLREVEARLEAKVQEILGGNS